MALANVNSSQIVAVLSRSLDPALTANCPGKTSDEADGDHKSDVVVVPSQHEATLDTGVQAVQGVASIWSSRTLVLAYALIWGLFFVLLMQMQSLTTLSAFITSDFGFHSLTPTISVIANVMAGVLLLPVSRLIDMFGRPHGMAFSTTVATIGLVLMAAAQNIEMTAAAEVLLTIGQNALFYTVNIFVADTSSLKNRALALAFASSPNLGVVWIVGYFNDAFINGPGWHWGFATFAFVNPFVTLPLFALIFYYSRKARKVGLIGKRQRRNAMAYLVNFDVVGLVIISAGASLFLLSFNLASFQTDQWRSPMIISFIVVGFMLIISAIFWELYGTSVTCIPYSMLRNRTVAGSAIVSTVLFVTYYCWASYFPSFLLVVNGVDVRDATYVANANTASGTLFNFAIGWWLHRTGKFRGVTIWMGIPLSLLGLGLMIYFRQPSQSIGYLVMCQIFVSCGNSIVTMTATLSAMAAVPHEQVAIVIAIISIFSAFGAALGNTISAAIWQTVFRAGLETTLPASELANIDVIYGDIVTQLSYPVGSDARTAIQASYDFAQTRMLTAAMAVWTLGFVGAAMWENIDLKARKQTKGNVV